MEHYTDGIELKATVAFHKGKKPVIPKQRALSVMVPILILLGFFTTIHFWQSRPPPIDHTPIDLPAADEVESISARCLPFRNLPGTETEEFTVPREYQSDLLRVLGKPVRNNGLTRFHEEGADMWLHCRDGRTIVIQLYGDGKEPARYLIDGVQCERSGDYLGDPRHPITGGSPGYLDESNVIADVLRSMSRKPLDEVARKNITWWLDRLFWSAGLKVSSGKN